MTAFLYEVEAPPFTKLVLSSPDTVDLFARITHMALEHEAGITGGEFWLRSPNELKVTPFRWGDTVKYLLDSSIRLDSNRQTHVCHHLIETVPPNAAGEEPLGLRDGDSGNLLAAELGSRDSNALRLLRDIYLQEVPQLKGAPQL